MVTLTFSDSEILLLLPDPDKNAAIWVKRFLIPQLEEKSSHLDLSHNPKETYE